MCPYVCLWIFEFIELLMQLKIKRTLKKEDCLKIEDNLKKLWVNGSISKTKFPDPDTFKSCKWQPTIANCNYNSLGPKIISDPKKFWVNKNLWSKKILGPKNIGSKKI